MGGEGSGRFRRRGVRRTIEEVPALDVRAWAREGLLVEGQWFSARMVGDGRFPLSVEVERDAVRITKMLEALPGPAGMVVRIQLERTHPHFGGLRWWFRCPGHDCGRRVALVYAAGREFICRRCLGLAYESQRENRRFRALRRAQKIRVRLGASANITQPFPLRPRSMHVMTYLRYMRRMSEAERAFWAPGKLVGEGYEKVGDDTDYGCP